ncbi:hypothetical protein [Crenobacter cavernae]|uniref:hypothetical protein n=1 Tax=Crenobacter cavernae TaxID=2290923 RepID=UPI0011C0677F|nr:hypothetical protein [Crenobacter cavernae]
MIDAAHSSPHAKSPTARSSAHSSDCPDCHQPLPSSGIAQCPHCGRLIYFEPPAARHPALRRLTFWLLSLLLLAGATALFGWQLASRLGHPVLPRSEVVAAASPELDAPESLAPTGADVHPTLSPAVPDRPDGAQPALSSAADEASAALDADGALAAVPVVQPLKRKKAPSTGLAALPSRPAPQSVADTAGNPAVPNEAQFLMQQQTQQAPTPPN